MKGAERPPAHFLAGRRPVVEVLKSGQPVGRIFIATGLAPNQTLGDIRTRAERAAVPIAMVSKDELNRIAGGGNHQGVVAETGRYRYAAFDRLVARENPCILFLDGVMDPHNLGSLLRSADGARFDGVVVRAHRAVGVTSAVRRVSAGASEVVAVAKVDNIPRALDRAKEKGLWIVGLDEEGEQDIWSSDLMQAPVGMVLGAEDRGLSKGVRAACDVVARVPSRGRIGSLNVAVAGAVAMFEAARRREAASPRAEGPAER
ncbi:MAG: 23S rRNA (guanosine(2251)-2'-O)-methyltransferase RlmB [Actinobacteria bacterium]|nr:23S rRNA (guanosine(2251)-2'-O)-methyltransferase RlmB [Actinomycetota bacterium]